MNETLSPGSDLAGRIEKLLVYGIETEDLDGQATRMFPSYNDISEALHCSMQYVGFVSKDRDCANRREQIRALVLDEFDKRFIEAEAHRRLDVMRANLRIVSTWREYFEHNLIEGGVRLDSPSDFDRLVRLESFILGQADSRTEVNVSVNLDAMQQRHIQAEGAEPEVAGFFENTEAEDVMEAEWEEKPAAS